MARLSGDEFVILLPQLSREEKEAIHLSVQVAEKIRRLFAIPFIFGQYETTISTSIGITLFPKAQESVEDLLKEADMAMYRAKSSGRDGVCFFDRAMQIEAESRFALERDLRKALEREEIKLYLQPQVNNCGEVVGAEVLLRWQHPSHGLISPHVFIPIAEETGLILDIGAWVLEQGCRYLAKLENQGYLVSVQGGSGS